ncbi:hypothetical protein HZH66_003914 [Vespula vulgaris]|uniref:Uncharacterized protein n=1 Tax=Vespula vulgaris TaxID=7454 RepID=A0A834KE20_VESVU|nr:hypothetical protein HZH66_003914 [Vespula vulgaris]
MHERRGTEECGVDVVGAPRTGNRTFRSGNAFEAERVPSAKRTQSDTLSPLRPVFEGKADVSKPPPPSSLSAIREGYNTLREWKTPSIETDKSGNRQGKWSHGLFGETNENDEMQRYTS